MTDVLALQEGDKEAVGCASIQFKIVAPGDQFHHIHEECCERNTLIGGLKGDLEDRLGSAENQQWYYNETLLEDNKTLEDYGILGYGVSVIIVKITD